MNNVDSSISLSNPTTATPQNLSQNGRSPASSHVNHHPALAYQDVAGRTPVQMISNNHHITSVHHESGSSPGTLIQKRPPGRPKGTTKKHFMPIEEKVKRPVGRPRKDGLPAGSVPKRPKIIGKPPGRPRKNSTSDVDTLTMDVSMMAEYGGPSEHQSFEDYVNESPDPEPIPPATPHPHPYTPPTLPPRDSWVTTYSSLHNAVTAPSSSPHLPSLPPPPPPPPPAPTATTRRTTDSRRSISPPSGGFVSSYIPGTTLASPFTTVPLVTHTTPLLVESWASLSHDELLVRLVRALKILVGPSRASVVKAYHDHLPALIARTPTGIPSLYSALKTFQLPFNPPYFLLIAARDSQLPIRENDHRFFYWDPMQLVWGGIRCPSCNDATLQHRGITSSSPKKVYDIGSRGVEKDMAFWVIGCEYACASNVCPQRRAWESWDPEILSRLPPPLAEEFPAKLVPFKHGISDATEGVSKQLWRMVLGMLKAGLEKNAILEVLNNIWDGSSDSDIGGAEVADGMRNLEGQTSAFSTFEAAWQASDTNKHQSSPNGVLHHDSSSTSVTPVLIPRQMQQRPTTSQNHELLSAAQDSNSVLPLPTRHPIITIANIPASPATHAHFATPSDLNIQKHASSVQITSDQPTKRIRHCCKCGREDCKGKGGHGFCPRPCRDCGDPKCRGRNSRRPEKTCREGWP
ncbi:hypothetical protein SISSUDRAFT_1055132 [Sistotremastrum suecicum HHB10207 ss-3]|uniref:Uncharacterized protein n=1 Tax=Sistotremastrum suecicum HHB10207 ss-3 TaxID=1314776 RepID=A0A165Y0Q5_9AGAM|nr:hypothetical protein SISSUDRAFT_1055132 [Sistotremastrum suecicum HHB10207 ss-3]